MITEFFRVCICIVFLLFCIVYYKEYEKKSELEHQEQIIRLSFEQQKRELESMKEMEREVRILRHDMRLFLNTLVNYIHQDDKESALKLAGTLASNIENTTIHHYCEQDMLNHILSYYAYKCKLSDISLQMTVELSTLMVDEVMFSSILSNALDNAIHAVMSLSVENRSIKLLLKNINGKLLLSVKNPFQGNLVFADGLPISDQSGHGYGTQSIQYMTERLGGNCQFIVEGQEFILRVVIN